MRQLELIPAYGHRDEIVTLFTEYTNMLMEQDETVRQYLILQNYEKGQNAESALATHTEILNALKSGDFLQVGYAIRASVDLWSTWIGQENARDIVLAELWKTNRPDRQPKSIPEESD